MGLSSITVKWEPVPQGSQYTVLTGYRVRYRQTFSNGSDGEIQIISQMGLATKATLIGLEEASVYRIEVAWETSAGPGVYSEPVTAKTCKSNKSVCFFGNSPCASGPCFHGGTV